MIMKKATNPSTRLVLNVENVSMNTPRNKNRDAAKSLRPGDECESANQLAMDRVRMLMHCSCF